MSSQSNDIAVIAMDCRFPGARNIQQFWHNIKNGIESISHFSNEELIESGIHEDEFKKNNYVPVKGIINNVDKFDADFFGYSPKDAKWMDPQHRVFLELAYSALEQSGYNHDQYHGEVGVFASAGFNMYLLNTISRNPELLHTINNHHLIISSGNDFLATRVAYNLNLKGPAQTIQTACSSSLVAVHHACQSLLSYQCDIAIAGGVAITTPVKSGYSYMPEGIASPDGHCRPFDSRAAGTVPGNGAGVVILKRLSEALSDGDYIYSVVKGSAINNDGNHKAGFTAPSAIGQAKTIATAQALAQVSANTISYIEGHGTGTLLGDPIEVSGLEKAFAMHTNDRQYCAIGSVKANIGHLDAAAGIAGFIKTSLCLHNKYLPPAVNFSKANSNINFEQTPFYINQEGKFWEVGSDSPRRAGVSAFGIGGTNAHLILEENQINSDLPVSPDGIYVLPISAKTEIAAEEYANNIEQWLHDNCDNIANIKHIASTMQNTRQSFAHRKCIIVDYKQDSYRIEKVASMSQLHAVVPRDYWGHIASQWMQGLPIDLSVNAEHSHTVVLPTYPFERTSYWLSQKEQSPVMPATQQSISYDSSDILSTLSEIMAKLLEIDSVDPDKEFSYLGADSYILIDYMLQVDEALSVSLSSSDLARYPTLNSLARKVQAMVDDQKVVTTGMDDNLVVNIHNGKEYLQPLFCIHPAGGSSAIFQELGGYIDSNRTVIAIQARGWNGMDEPDQTIEQMAKRYIRLITHIQSEGPYLLCGSSLGGTIAYEMASAMQRDGLTVSTLAMLDSPPPAKDIIKATDTPKSPQEILSYVHDLSQETYTTLLRMQHDNADNFERFCKLWQLHSTMVQKYQPTNNYEGDIIYFRAQERDRYLPHHFEQGWLPYSKDGFQIHEVPGNHITMHLSPNVQEVAKILNERILQYV